MIRKYFLAIKYFIQGDDWERAVEYADYITRWTKNREKQIAIERRKK